VLTKKEQTRNAIADKEVPFSLGAHEEGFARRVMSPRGREPTRKQLLTRTALSLSKRVVRSGAQHGQDALRSAIAGRSELSQGALSTRRRLGMVGWCGFHGENERSSFVTCWGHKNSAPNESQNKNPVQSVEKSFQAT
jgi:hypothetical protein